MQFEAPGDEALDYSALSPQRSLRHHCHKYSCLITTDMDKVKTWSYAGRNDSDDIFSSCHVSKLHSDW